MRNLIFIGLTILFFTYSVKAEILDAEDSVGKVDENLGASREASRTDDQVVEREREAIKIDDLNVAQKDELNKKAENYTFKTEVNRLMKLIINSLYRNKEIFLRELISNASDALDKIRVLALRDPNALHATSEFAIRIKADPENNILSITDTGVGMTKEDLKTNLGTIAKSGTADFLGKLQEADSNRQDTNDMIGQFGVGFYSGFLVANKIVVTSKHNDDKQYIWESDSNNFSITEDPQGDTLLRGTTISLYLKEEASDFLQQDTIANLIKKYSQFINFPIYLWMSKSQEVEEEETPETKPETTEASDESSEDAEKKDEDEESEDAEVEEETAEPEKKKKTISKTVWDWELMNKSKPLWTLKPANVSDEEYNEFYKALTKDSQDPLARTHFSAEGEVSFKSLLYIPKVQPEDSFNRYGTKADNIKLYVRRVFITDKINDMMPNYLNFIRGIVDSDDLPLNVSREELQQHKLIKVIKKKLVRKVLEMISKISKDEYEKFWKEYSTNVKLGILEDSNNRARLAKLLQFKSSQNDMTSFSDYVSRMKPNQSVIYYVAGSSVDEVKKSPFVERLVKKGYEVLYLTEAVDEYVISAIPQFEEKKFLNVAKEHFTLDDSEKSKQRMEEIKTTYEPLIKWLNNVLSSHISKAQISERLTDSSCALVASMFGWTGNMERIAISNAHQKTDDPQKSYYLNQKKTLEINPRHPLIRELLRRVTTDSEDPVAKNIATMMFHTATLRSGYMLKETGNYAENVEQLMKKSLGIPEDEMPEEEEEEEEEADDETTDETESEKTSENTDDNTEEENNDHDEL